MDEPYPSPADSPKTDREWLTRVESKLDRVIDKIEGKDGLCETQKLQQKEIDELKKWRIYQTVLLIVLIFLITGRYIVGPTSIPLVP